MKRVYWVWEHDPTDPHCDDTGTTIIAEGYPQAKRAGMEQFGATDYLSMRAIVLPLGDPFAEKGYLTDVEALDVGLGVPCADCGVEMLTRDDQPMFDPNGHPICRHAKGEGCHFYVPSLDSISDY